MAIDETAALQSASWGLGQVLGENHAMVGYDTVQAMVLALRDDAEVHLEMMVAFILAARLDDNLRAHDWSGFARGYNGPQYAKHGYHTRLAAAFARWSRIRDTPWSPAVPVPTTAPRSAEPAPPVVTAPATVGHNGGPTMEPEPPVVIVAAPVKPVPTGTSTSKAKGGAIGAGLVGPILVLFSKFGWIPVDVAHDPDTLIIVTTLVTAGAAYAGAWLSPRNRVVETVT